MKQAHKRAEEQETRRKTEILNPARPEDMQRAVQLLRSGELVVFPSETVYGLGASADNASAVAGIYRAKGRPADNPLIVHVADLAMAAEYALGLGRVERALFAELSPGALSIVCRRRQGRAEAASAGLESLALRIPRAAILQSLLRGLGSGIAAPSANVSGRPSPTNFGMAYSAMNARVAAIIRGGQCELGIESTVVRCVYGGAADERGSGVPLGAGVPVGAGVEAESPFSVGVPGAARVEVLRPGSVRLQDIRAALARAGLGGVQLVLRGAGEGSGGGLPAANLPAGEAVLSPGTRYRHYAPESPLSLFSSLWELQEALRVYINKNTQTLCFILLKQDRPALVNVLNSPALDSLQAVNTQLFCCESEGELAQNFYRYLYDIDKLGNSAIFCYLPPETESNAAIRDRMRRAAACTSL